MLKLCCTLPILAIICLHKSTDSKFYPLTETDKYFLEKLRERMVGGPSIVFTRKAVGVDSLIQKSTNLCRIIVAIDASQLYPYPMCQSMPSCLYTRWEYESETQRFTPRQIKSRSFQKMVLSFLQKLQPQCRIESNVTTGWQKKDCFNVDVDGVWDHCNANFEAMGR